MNRETKRMMQRQGQMEADGSPATRRRPPPPSAGKRQVKRRTTPAQFVREVRDEMRQVAWPGRAELINYSTVVLVVLILMIGLIFLLNLAFGKVILQLFQT